MPIIVKSKEYVSGSFLAYNQLPFLRANTGDQIGFVFYVESNIRLTSLTNPLILDPSTNTVTSSSISWLDEGFRENDSVTFTVYSSGGAVVSTWTTTINWVNDTEADFGSIVAWYDINAGEFIEVIVNVRGRDDLDIFINQVLNGQQGSAASLIDGELTRAVFTGLEAVPVGGFLAGQLVGNQSGNYMVSAGITREANPANQTREYRISLQYYMQGIHDSTWFDLGGCLKTFIRLEWASIGGEPYDRAVVTFSDDADTGWFNQPYNTGVANSTLVQAVQGELSYCESSTFEVIVDGPTFPLGLGLAANIQDETTYKNLPTTAARNAIMQPSFDINVITNVFAYGANGENIEINIDSVNTVGSVSTITVTITPNAAFADFFDARVEGDRQFYIWITCGNVNHLVYSGQLVCPPTPAGPLTMESSAAFLDHDYNLDTFVGDKNDRPFNTEDDIAYYGTFLLEKNEVFDEFVVTIEAYNSTSGDSFDLQKVIYNFSGVQISNDGRYLLDESQNIVSTLPNTSLKRNSLLKLEPSIDVGSQYGVSIYYPYLLRWEYWLEQLNANVDFYPNQNKDWTPYDNTGDWGVRLKLQLVQDNLSYEHYENVDILDYDSEPLISSSIELIRESTGQTVGVVIEGEIMRIRAEHELLNGQWYDVNELWGMITVEPTEAAPRWIVSSEVETDNNTNNPLTAITPPLMTLTLISPTVVRMEAFFNPDLINLSNGVKFTSKIKGCPINPIVEKTLTDGTTKTTTTSENKTLAN